MKTEIKPLNRLSVFFTEENVKYFTELSPDKNKITIKIPNCTAVESAKENHSTGIIQSIYIQNIKGSAYISVVLSEKRGYTASELPFSKTLMIEVFDWNKLNKDEENYRNGLLALENGIIKSAVSFLEKSKNTGNANAAAILGLTYLISGDIKNAEETLIFADKNNSNISDIYAALSQIYSIKNDKALSNKFKQKFAEKSGLSSFNFITLPDKPIIFETSNEPLSFLEKAADIEQLDSNDKKIIDSIKSGRGNDSVLKTKTDTTKKVSSETAKNINIFPDWYNKTYFYIAFSFLLVLLMIISMYLRWRKRQIKRLQRESTQKFKDKLQSAQNNISGGAHAAKAYQKNEDKLIVSKEKKSDEDNTQSNKKDNKGNESNLNDGALKKIAAEILASKPRQEERDEDLFIGEDTTSEKIKPVQTNPKLELALHLHDEQIKAKSKNIESIKSNEIPLDKKKLAETAKKLGVEKSLLETKRIITSLENDKSSLSKLAEKFKSSSSDNNEKK